MREGYDNLPLLPALIAEVVLESKYAGSEVSERVRDYAMVEKTELARRKMTAEQCAGFIELADRLCRDAYNAKAEWFEQIIKSRTSVGRDQLYIFMSHWLCAYLQGKMPGQERVTP